MITTVAGDGEGDTTEDNVTATSTSLSIPSDIAVDASGDIYIVDSGHRAFVRSQRALVS